MTFTSAAFLMLFCAFAFSFADIMRSASGGGARFVMLRGALFGLAASMFTGSSFFGSKPFMLSGICALAAYPGGGFSAAVNRYDPVATGVRRYISPFAEGVLTGGIFFGMSSFYISSAAGNFNIMQVVMLFALAPLFALAAYAFDRFYDAGRIIARNREIVIPLAGVLAAILIFSCFSGDTLMISATFSGSVLFAAAYTGAAFVNSRLSVLRSAILSSVITQEAVSGFLTGLSSALTLIICKVPLATRYSAVDESGFSQIGLHPVSGVIALVVLAMLAADQIQYFILPKWSEHAVLSFVLALLKKYEFLLYCVLPYAISCMGNGFLPEIIATVIISIFVWQLLCRRVFLIYPNHYIYVVILLIPILGLLFVRISTDWELSAGYLIFLYTALYEVCALYLDYIERGKTYLKREGLPRHIAGTVLSALLIGGANILPRLI